MRWSLGLVLWGLAIFPLAMAAYQAAQQQPPAGPPDQTAMQKAREAMQKASDADHQQMMDQLHVASIRRGRDGTKKDSPYYANYDESKANPFPNLPDPLTLKNGKKVANAKEWWSKRRPEIVEDFDREIYGRVPKNVPKVQWAVTETVDEKVGDVPVIRKQLVGTVDNSASPHRSENPADAGHPG